MACSHLLKAEIEVIPNKEEEKEEDFIEGIVIGLKDFAEGRYTVFEDDDEMEAYLMKRLEVNESAIVFKALRSH